MEELIFSDFDRNGNRVLLSTRRWNFHILERHPEVGPYLEIVADVLKSPDIVTRDSGGAYHYGKREIMQGHPYLYLDVVVIYEDRADSTTGEIVTMFFNGRSPKGELLWTKQN